MSPTWDQLAAWDPTAIGAITDVLVADRKTLVGLQEHIDDSAAPKHWSGQAADAAQAQLANYTERLEVVVAGLSAVISRAEEIEERIAALRRAIEDAEGLARAHGMWIENGNLVDTSLVLDSTPQDVIDTHRAVTAEVIDRIARIMERGTEIDHDFAAVINAVVSGEIDDRGSSGLGAAMLIGMMQGFGEVPEVPEDATPTENAAWWATLTDGERNWLIENRPDLIGNLDGLPAAARSEANMLRLPAQRELLETLIAHREAQRADLWPWDVFERREIDAAIARLEAKLDAITNIESIMFEGGELRTDRTLITFDLDGERARAAIGSGNVDGADQLGVFIPGMGSTVEGNLDRYVDEMEEIQRYAQKMLDDNSIDQEVAVVTWLDYEPPQVTVSEGVQGTTRDRAEEGAQRLASYLDGIEAHRGGDNAVRLTSISHSYGGVTAGLAMRESSAADAAVFHGSPGTGSVSLDGTRGHLTPDGGTLGHAAGEQVPTNSNQMKVPQGALYNLSIASDPVAQSGWHGVNPSLDAHITELDPDAVRTRDGEVLHNQRHGDLMSDHGEYSVADERMSASEYNTAAVLAGLPELAIEKP